MNVIAIGAHIILRPDAENASSQLVIPQVARKISNRGTIVSVGPGRRHIDGTIYPLAVKEGQRVMFSILRAFPFEVEGEKLMVMDAEDVLCILGLDPLPASN